MRRSAVVRLTLLPMLATAAVARADEPPPPAPIDPGDPPVDSLPLDFDTTLSPPGMTEPILMPPGLTPPIDCADDPDWDERPECTVSGGVIRGGFGHYFWVGGG